MILNFGRFLTVLILACVTAPAAAQHAGALRLADDLAATGAEARAQRVPVMLVFTETTCSYCARAKRNHLAPLAASRDYASRVVAQSIEALRSESSRARAPPTATLARLERGS